MYKMSDRVITCDDNNIKLIRDKHPEGLHFVAGDTHGELPTLMALMEKIEFDPHKDHVYFVGDYSGGGDPYSLLGYMSGYFQPDYERPGFHLIRGNHERELYPVYPLENLPDIIVIRGRQLNYYIVHAGMVSGAFHLINEDMAKCPIGRFTPTGWTIAVRSMMPLSDRSSGREEGFIPRDRVGKTGHPNTTWRKTEPVSFTGTRHIASL